MQGIRAAAAFLALVGFAASLAEAHGAKHGKIGALYFITNPVMEDNAVCACDIYADGSIKLVSKFYTGGKGDSILNGNVSGGPDALQSQMPVSTKGGKFLFAVNAGSNSVSMFKISPYDPTELKLVACESSGFDLPVSVTFSEKHMMACVLNGGPKNGIRCFSVTDDGFAVIPGTDRSLGLNISSPPVGPPNTVSEILFDAAEDNVLVSVKGTPGPPMVVGFVASYAVSAGGMVAAKPVKTFPSGGGLLPFGMSLVAGTASVLVTDPGVGVVVYDFKAGGSVPASTVSTVIPGQAATCWATYSPKTGSYFVDDIASSIVVELTVNKAGTVASFVKNVTVFDPSVGLLEMAVASPKHGPDFLFVNAAAADSILMYKLYATGVESPVVTYDLQPMAKKLGLTLTKAIEGMAVVML